MVEWEAVYSGLGATDARMECNRLRCKECGGLQEGCTCCPEDCQMCSGEYCENHFAEPCDCDVVDRHHYVPRTANR